MKISKWIRSVALTLAFLLAAQVSPIQPLAQEAAANIQVLQQQHQSLEEQSETSPSEVSPEDIVGEIVEKREPNVKHFLLESGQIIAATYPQTVHELVDGQWQEIDNSLEREPLTRSSNGSLEISNQASGFRVSFREGEGNKLIEIQKESSMVSWNLQDAGEKNLTISQPDDAEPSNPFAVKNIKSSGTYQDILLGTDIEYILNGTTIKENIVVENLSSIRSYQFDLVCQNASAVLKEDKSIAFLDEEGNIIFSMQAPVMYDAVGEYSDAVEVRLTPTENGYRYELIPDGGWMSEPERVYPITIDPTVETDQDTKGVQSTYIKESMPTTRLRNEARIWVGSASAKIPAACRALIKVTLPTLTSADYVTSTYLQLTPIATHYLGWNSDGIDNYYFTAHRVTSDWDPSTVTWNTQPQFDPSVVDYKMARINNYDYNFNITEIAKEWYNTGVNTGLELQLNQEEGFCFFGEFGADSTMNDDPDSYPVLYITYMNTAGMENFWTYQTTSAGEAGAAFVQNHTGHLTYAHDDLGLGGNIMPVAISHVYNSTYKDENIGYGLGWQTNYDQTVTLETIGNRKYYIYRDSDGTKHSFDATESKEEYEDSSGLELKLKINTGSSDAYYVITDQNDNKLNFDQNGYLKTICNARDQSITVSRDSGGKIQSIADGTNRVFTFAYDGDNLSSITTPDGRQQRMSYTGSQLTGIGYDDTTSSDDTKFTYDGNGLVSAQSRFDDRVDMTYNANGSVTLLEGSYVNEGQTAKPLSFPLNIPSRKQR